MFPNSIIQLIVDTGNLNTCTEFKRNATQLPTEELVKSVNATLSTWQQSVSLDALEDQKVAECTNSDHLTTVDKDERRNLKLTVKIFLYSFDCEALTEAVERAMKHLDVKLIDSLIVAFPSSTTSSKLALNDIQLLWKVLEDMVNQNKVVTIGVSDLDTCQLQDLYYWAEVKPSVNQVNLESCCVMPVEMTAFANENDIQLLTHSDPKVLLPEEMVHTVLGNAISTTDVWKTRWIVRYSVMVKCRGIIQNKGYIFCAQKHHVCVNNGQPHLLK